VVTRSSSQLIEYFHNAFIHEVNISESEGVGYRLLQPTNTHKIFKILHTIQTILESESEIGFDDI
jgi:hypothetical protein